MKIGHKITQENAIEARQLMKKTQDKKSYRKLEVIALRGEGKTNVEISEITGYSLKYLSTLLKKFVNEGYDEFLTDKRGGNRRKVSQELELSFLERYEKKSELGEICTVKEMWLDFKEQFNTSMTLEGFYKLLHRHGWRKVTPRTTHPKSADAQTIEASKKLKMFTNGV